MTFCSSTSGATAQVCRPHFHTPLHPWMSDSKPVVPHAAHSGWISPFSKSLSHHSPSAPLTVASTLPSVTSVSSHSLFPSFPPTPPKDSSPDMGSSTAGPTQNTSGTSGHEYGSLDYKHHDYKPSSLKSEGPHGDVSASMPSSMSSSMSFGMTSAATAQYPMATYSSYMGGPDYTTSPLFHPASMFKAASFARVRTKSRSSSGKFSSFIFYLDDSGMCLQ